ncbi:ankyrin repeat-containing domain protein [Apiospora hydei]|uniref:Ankyrin repeat-containing domain protein n=1 Tax=Apiospora hydei TaxID=1337664 RepID=A0ABR1XDY0_9PEZI
MYYSVVEPYLEHGEKEGDRAYLSEILQTWSPEADPGHAIGEALHWAIFKGYNAAVQMMMDAVVSPKVQQSSDPGFTPLLAASQHGRLAMARLFWRLVGPEGRCCPLLSRRGGGRGGRGRGRGILRGGIVSQIGRGASRALTCLRVAARNNHPDLVAYFLDVWDGWTDDEKRQALNDAAHAWCDDAVAVLLSKVAYESTDIQKAVQKAVTRRTVLMESPTRPDPNPDDFESQRRLVRRLIEAGGDPEGETGSNHWPLLHQAAISPRCDGALKGLLEKGADPNRPGPQGKNALHFACSSFNPLRPQTTALDILLQHGALSEMADEEGEIALHGVAQFGSLAQLQLCLSHCRGAFPDAPESMLHVSNAHGGVPPALRCGRRTGRRHGRVPTDLGLDINATNDNGWTPLMCALSPTRLKMARGMYRTAETLLKHGARADIVTDEDWTPLHALGSWGARWQPYPDPNSEIGRLARTLLAGGAPVDVESSVIRSPSCGTRTLSDAWGFRMRVFLETTAKTTLGQDPDPIADFTTPLIWARRCHSIDLERAIEEHLVSVSIENAA